MEVADSALDTMIEFWLKQGYRLFWTHPDKKPAVLWSREKKGTRDRLELIANYRPGYQLAGTPPQGVSIIDVDVKGGANGLDTLETIEREIGTPLPETVIVSTPSGGVHFHYRANLPQFQGRSDLPGIDVRAHGKGYVLLPPAQGYAMVGGKKIAELPGEWVTRLKARSAVVGGGPPGAGTQCRPHETQGEKNPAPEDIITKWWRQGNRDTLAMALAGVAIKEMYPEAAFRKAINQICDLTGDEEKEARLQKYALARSKPIASLAGYSLIEQVVGNEDEAKALLRAFMRLMAGPWYGCLYYTTTDSRGNLKEGFHKGEAAVRRLWRAGLGDVLRRADLGVEQHLVQWDDNLQRWRILYDSGEQAQAIYRIMVEAVKPLELPSMAAAEEVLKQYLAMNLPEFTVQNHGGRYIQFKNGVLDTQTMELLTPSREYGLMPFIPLDWHPEATCPVTERWMKEAVRPGWQRVLWALVRCAIAGQNPTQVIVHLYGPGGSGKTTFMELLRFIVGDENVASMEMDLLNRPFEIARLAGKNVALFPDINSYSRQTRILKQLSGQDLVRAENKFQTPFSFVFRGLLVMSSNYPPDFDSHDSGMARRFRMIEFPHGLEQRGGRMDTHLLEKIQAEAPGIVRKALEMSLEEAGEVLLNPGKAIPSYHKEVVEAKVNQGDPLTTLLRDNIEFAPGEFVPVGQKLPGRMGEAANQNDGLYPMYLRATEENGGRCSFNLANFMNQAITKLSTLAKAEGYTGPMPEKERRRVNGKKQFVITNIRWRKTND